MKRSKSWLPEGVTEVSLPDSAFAWMSTLYVQGEESKSKGRLLPFMIDGKVSEDGWKSAWTSAREMKDADFDGGPTKAEVIAKLRQAKPANVQIEDEGDKDGEVLLERKNFTFTLKALPAGDGADDENALQTDCFEGYASTWDLDETGDMIEKGAFALSLAEYQETGTICWQHFWDTPIGKPLDVHEDDTGLFVRAKISQTEQGKDALILLRDGVVTKMSIGFVIEGYRILSDEEGEALLGVEEYAEALRTIPWWRDGIRVITQIKLYEISLVTIPANMNANVTGVKNGLPAGLKLDAQFESVLAANSDLHDRFKSVLELRLKSGRTLSAANLDRLQTMRDSLSDHVDTLDALISSASPKDPDGDDEEAPDEVEEDGAGKSTDAEVETKEPELSDEELETKNREAARAEYAKFLAITSGVKLAA